MKPISTLARAICATCVFLAATAAWATPPAAIPDSPDQRARRSFLHFAQEWISKMQHLEVRNRANPELRPGAARPIVSYRGYGTDFSTELKPTGHPQAPFVGILRYTEHLYTCADTEATRCSVATTTPVTEIFRFQNGRWVY